MVNLLRYLKSRSNSGHILVTMLIWSTNSPLVHAQFRQISYTKRLHLLGLDKRTYEHEGVDTEGNVPGSYKEPGIGWMTGFLFLTSFIGLLALVPLRKIMIIDNKLSYPSGTTTAVLINGLHTGKSDKMANFLDYALLDVKIDIITIVGSLVKSGIPVLVYSGDEDSVIPLAGSRTLVNCSAQELKLNATVP